MYLFYFSIWPSYGKSFENRVNFSNLMKYPQSGSELFEEVLD